MRSDRKGGGVVVFLLFLLGVILTVGLYFVKTKVQSARTEVNNLTQRVENERYSVKLLAAELAHQESPDRIAVLAENSLGMTSTGVVQAISLDEIEEHFPLREEFEMESPDE